MPLCHCVTQESQLYAAGKFTNLLFLKRLLDLLQIGEQADVCADLQADRKGKLQQTAGLPLTGSITYH